METLDTPPAPQAPPTTPATADGESAPTGDRRASLRRWAVSLAVVVAIAVGIYLLDEGRATPTDAQSVTVAASSGPAPRVGNPAPDFEVVGLDGQSIRLSDYRGRPVWLNFWASWCPPCRAETPDLIAAYQEKRASGLVLLAVSIGEDATPVRRYAETAGITFTVGLDPSTVVAGRYRVNGIPTHYFIDRGGVIQDIQVGGLNRTAIGRKLAKLGL